MQTLTDIRRLLAEGGLSPSRALGQNFLIDRNLMAKLVELATLSGPETVLEVGPGTGSLTEELLPRCRRLVAVELDRGLAEMLRRRFATASDFTLLHCDVLAGKRSIDREVLAAVHPRAHLVANLPYNVATPLLAECLRCSWNALRPSRRGETGAPDGQFSCLFERMTFTVQEEVADRLTAQPGDDAYGAVSILVRLLSRATRGPRVPASAFWPRPKVSSRILRLDFDAQAARRLADLPALDALLTAAFAQRRKQMASLVRRKDAPFSAAALTTAMEAAGVDARLRPEQVSPEAYLAMANALARSVKG